MDIRNRIILLFNNVLFWKKNFKKTNKLFNLYYHSLFIFWDFKIYKVPPPPESISLSIMFPWKLDCLSSAITFAYNSIPHLLLMFVGIAYYSFYKKIWSGKMFVFMLTSAFVVCSISYTLLYSYNLILAVSYFLIPFVAWFLFYWLDINNKLPKSKVFNYLANISFSLYLTHQILGFALEAIFVTKLNFNIYLSIFISLLICFIWSSIIFFIVERKSQIWSKSF